MNARKARKILVSLFILVFIFSNATVFAQMPIAATGVMPSLGELSKIGVVAAIQGKVEVMTPGAAGRVVQSGEEIFIGDEVKTDAVGHLQILLLDETVFTIGPNSAITIDKFIYDPGTHVGKVEASIAKGVFRYVSGKIAANKPENVQINLPTATIGIRGTIIAGEVSATGAMAMLMGPGSRNETGATIGSFVINGTGENSGQQEHVNRTGFGVSVDQTGSVSGVFMVPEIQVQHLGEALLPAPGQVPGIPSRENDPNAPLPTRPSDQGPSGVRSPAPPGAVLPPPQPGLLPPPTGTVPMDGGTTATTMTTTSTFGADFSAGQTSGATSYASFQMLGGAEAMGTMITDLSQDTTLAAQEIRTDTAIQSTANVVDHPYTRKFDMTTSLGIVTYRNVSLPFLLNGNESTLRAFINVDFGNQKLVGGSGGSSFEIIQNGNSVDKCELVGSPSFTTMDSTTPLAKFVLTGPALNNTFDTARGTFNSVTLQFQDTVTTLADGTPSQVDRATQVEVKVEYASAVSVPAPQNVVVDMIAPQVT